VPDLRLGPILRYADEHRATVWVETDTPCEVEIAGHRERTFAVEGHHYAIVTIHERSGEPYEVALDGERVWPPPASAHPPSRLGNAPTEQRRVVFGSCRTVLGAAAEADDPDGIDALREYALRASAQVVDALPDALPDLLVFLGDQVYDRQGAPATRAFIRARRRVDVPPGEVVADFEEYTRLYWEAWSDPAVRWLLSTVPSLMIFDDHDIVDNWNTSAAWVEEMRATPGWQERITGGLMAYWLYQHLGNLDPAQLAADPILAELRGAADGASSLREYAASSDAGSYGTPGAQWSFARDVGDVRVVMVDSRNGRCMTAGQREILDEEEWAWLEAQVRGAGRHLLLGTSVPFLLPRGLHHHEAWVNAVCDGAWGRRAIPIAERVRRELQLTKWASFPSSFERLGALLQEVAAADDAPASIVVLSGDVHFSYLARLTGGGAPVHQVVASPLCYDLERRIRGGFRAAMSTVGARVGRMLARRSGVPPVPLDWRLTDGPYFRNTIATLELVGGEATARLEQTRIGTPGDRLAVVAERLLTPAGPRVAEAR
jgi:hypothetical protein